MVLSTLLILQHSIVVKYSCQKSRAPHNKSSPPSMFINKLEAVLLHFCCLAHLETIHIYTPRCFCVLDVKEVTKAHICTIRQNMNFPFFQIHSIPDGIVTLKCHYIIVSPNMIHQITSGWDSFAICGNGCTYTHKWHPSGNTKHQSPEQAMTQNTNDLWKGEANSCHLWWLPFHPHLNIVTTRP